MITNGSELDRFFADREILAKMLDEWARDIGAERDVNAQEFAEKLIKEGFRRQTLSHSSVYRELAGGPL